MFISRYLGDGEIRWPILTALNLPLITVNPSAGDSRLEGRGEETGVALGGVVLFEDTTTPPVLFIATNVIARKASVVLSSGRKSITRNFGEYIIHSTA